MKTLIMILAIIFCLNIGAAQDNVLVPRETLIKIRDYIVQLQGEYNMLVEELNKRDMVIATLYNKLETYKRRSSGVWLGALAGVPFPAASVQGGYIINNNVGVMINGGYAGNPYIQAGVMVRVGK